MDPEMFTINKIILEEFYKNRTQFIYNNDITIEQETGIYSDILSNGIIFRTSVKVYNHTNLNITTKEVHKFLKPFIYYLFSLTYKKKFVREGLKLFTESINIFYSYHSINSNTISVNRNIDIGFSSNLFDDNNFIEDYDVESSNRSLATGYIHYLKVNLRTYYDFENYEDYIEAVANLEENGEIVVIDNEEEKTINTTQVFKTDECVICLTKPPNILFCNCGHQCLCTECEKIKSLSVCPICKTENTIFRCIE